LIPVGFERSGRQPRPERRISQKQHGRRSGIDLTKASVTLATMKRRLLFFILLAIVLALLIKYGANAASLASG
jgi:hypothetical protein